MNSNEIIDNLIAKICHDLLNPLSTAQMALETQSIKYIKPALDELTSKVDMIRFLYRDSIHNETKYEKLNNYIEIKKLNLKIAHQHNNIAPLLFWIAEKMISKSYIYVEESAIHLQNFFIDEEEISILENNVMSINSRNIFLYITMKKLANQYDFSIKELGPNEWKIAIKNK